MLECDCEPRYTVDGSRLLIYQKQSLVAVKTAVALPSGLADCSLVTDRVIRLLVWRLPLGARATDGVYEQKEYLFQFPTKSIATEFLQRLTQPP